MRKPISLDEDVYEFSEKLLSTVPTKTVKLLTRVKYPTPDGIQVWSPCMRARGCHKDAQPFFFYYGIHSLMVGTYQILRYLSW